MDPGVTENERRLRLIERKFGAGLSDEEAAGRGEKVAAEGDERLRLSLAILRGLTEHAAEVVTHAGGVESETLRRAREGLRVALGE